MGINKTRKKMRGGMDQTPDGYPRNYDPRQLGTPANVRPPSFPASRTVDSYGHLLSPPSRTTRRRGASTPLGWTPFSHDATPTVQPPSPPMSQPTSFDDFMETHSDYSMPPVEQLGRISEEMRTVGHQIDRATQQLATSERSRAIVPTVVGISTLVTMADGDWVTVARALAQIAISSCQLFLAMPTAIGAIGWRMYLLSTSSPSFVSAILTAIFIYRDELREMGIPISQSLGRSLDNVAAEVASIPGRTSDFAEAMYGYLSSNANQRANSIIDGRNRNILTAQRAFISRRNELCGEAAAFFDRSTAANQAASTVLPPQRGVVQRRRTVAVTPSAPPQPTQSFVPFSVSSPSASMLPIPRFGATPATTVFQTPSDFKSGKTPRGRRGRGKGKGRSRKLKKLPKCKSKRAGYVLKKKKRSRKKL